MLFIDNKSLDPYYNIALEEYLLKSMNANIIMLWRSRPSIIVGKHQNTLAEINLEFVRKKDIPVIRRLSGGGTVFHDPGNINFTFIKNSESSNIVDFKGYTQPIIDFLKTLELNAHFEGKNDLRINGLKISGNAEHVFKNRVLHHGTLLFDANLQNLNEAIKSKEKNFTSKAVKSVRSKVANIADFLNEPMHRNDFFKRLREYLISSSSVNEIYTPSAPDMLRVGKLIDEKYKTWDWNFGYSPTFTLFNQGKVSENDYDVRITVTKGIISQLEIRVNNETLSDDFFKNYLREAPHRPDVIEKALKEVNFGQISNLSDPWELISLFF
jgi:lipoate-protein ligase A